MKNHQISSKGIAGLGPCRPRVRGLRGPGAVWDPPRSPSRHPWSGTLDDPALRAGRVRGLLVRRFHWKMSKIRIFWRNLNKNAKKFNEFLLTFWIWSGAKVWQSCRSRKMLKNEYLGVKNGLDTDENEPSKVWSFSLKNTEIYCIEFFN